MAQNKETYIAQRKAEIACIEAKIRVLLGWDEMQYNLFVYESGLCFIEKYYRYTDLIQCVERSRAFWNWWKVTWWNDDEKVLTFIIPQGFTRQDTLNLYCQIHSVEVMVQEAFPPANIWSDIRNIQKEKSWA